MKCATRVCAAALAALGVAAGMGLAAPAAIAEAQPSARALAAAGLPDWSGVWARSQGNIFDPVTADPPKGFAGTPGVREHPPYTPAFEAKYEANIARIRADTLPDPLNSCLPRGMPGDMSLPDQYEFAVTPDKVFVFGENGAQVRRIYTDGRPQLTRDDLFPTYTGDSVGHWEGDTLVVRTVGLRDDMLIDRTGAIISSDAVINERMRMTGPNSFEDRFTIEDKTALTKPWVVTRTWRRMPAGSQIFDYACGENNRNPVDANGVNHVVGPGGKLID